MSLVRLIMHFLVQRIDNAVHRHCLIFFLFRHIRFRGVLLLVKDKAKASEVLFSLFFRMNSNSLLLRVLSLFYLFL